MHVGTKNREKIPGKTEVMVDQIRHIRILPWNESVTSMYIGVDMGDQKIEKIEIEQSKSNTKLFLKECSEFCLTNTNLNLAT